MCNYYHAPVIDRVSITLSDKSKEPIGTFTCPKCGFSYTRRGPDCNKEDKYRKTRVKEYGHLWMRKLEEYLKQGHGLRELSRKMGADPNTIKRYLEYKEDDSKDFLTHSEADRERWLSLQNQYPCKNVKQLRQEDNALYMRLFRNDTEWMKENNPKSEIGTSRVRVDWNKRDDEVLGKVTNVIENLLNPEEKPIRITVSKVGFLIGERALLEKKLDKMPKTKTYLQGKVETLEQFQERRILYTIKCFKENSEELVPWKIIRKSGIKGYKKWLDFIETNIR